MSEGMDGLIACLFWVVLIGSAVILNAVLTGARPSTTTKTGPAWEQDAPYPECFEEDRDDDL